MQDGRMPCYLIHQLFKLELQSLCEKVITVQQNILQLNVSVSLIKVDKNDRTEEDDECEIR